MDDRIGAPLHRAAPPLGTVALQPDLLIFPDGAREGLCVAIGPDGRLAGLIPAHEAAHAGIVVERLAGRALLPGFVNVHSHVFQRRLRGRTHRGMAKRDSFWTWREAMYCEAHTLTPESLYRTAHACYREMLEAGYTAVGEFHYLHHQPGGTPYDDPLALSRAVIAAAADAGIRLLLLPVAYNRAGFDRPAEPLQRRFCFPEVDAYLEHVDRLRAEIDDPRQAIGMAPHSVRAVPEHWLGPIAAYAQRHALPLHTHVAEQVGELEEVARYLGCTPIELLARHNVLGPSTTLVHATHATEGDCALIGAAGAAVCVCPSTEGDLGDGIAPYAAFVEHGIRLAIGSDGQTRIDPLEELRWLEFSARMRYQRRRILATGLESPGGALLQAGTLNGARSLAIDAGSLEPGGWADLVAVDLAHPSLIGADPLDLTDTLIFGAGAAVVREVWVAGRRVVP